MPLRRRGSQFRRLPHRCSNPPAGRGPARPASFERLVERALDALPAHVRALLDNVAIVVEDEPSAEQLRTSGSALDESLYGLYEGTPGVEYGADWVPFPNKISLFRLPLEEDFPDPSELAEQVRRTVVHELAHHAGISDERLERYGLD
ncbi:MAG TPA: metallopeptidase family protein [Candidatus Limnocylindria bacterium]|nr:metallopeptidase family protein [Candidatus Limnocylindria bacterium]